jgi:hypothetical protein
MTSIAHQDPMQQRIDHLEGLVKRLLAQQEDVPPNNLVCHQDSPKPGVGFEVPAVASDASDVAYSAGTTVIDGARSVYKGSDNWHDVLHEVSPSLSILLFPFLVFPLFDT